MDNMPLQDSPLVHNPCARYIAEFEVPTGTPICSLCDESKSSAIKLSHVLAAKLFLATMQAHTEAGVHVFSGRITNWLPNPTAAAAQ